MLLPSKRKPPFFIVGMPRSGTKLLRSILNNHPLISIPTNETLFIPYFYNKYKNFTEFFKRNEFNKFYQEISKTEFAKRSKRKGKMIDPDLWYNSVTNWTYGGVISTFFELHAKNDNKIIWGDKTPSYLINLPIIFEIFPNCKVIQIIRDPRDYCRSINKAWSKNYYRAAQRWNDDVRKCRSDGLKFPEKYYELKYEDLLKYPEKYMKNVCQFLRVPFKIDMLSLRNPSENLGDAKGMLRIDSSNYGKWRYELQMKQVSRIESICTNLMKEFGYETSYKGTQLRITRRWQLIYKIADTYQLLKIHTKKNGLIEGLKLMRNLNRFDVK